MTVLLAVSGSEPIEATPEHPFWTPRGWVRAGDLTDNDKLFKPQLQVGAEPLPFDITNYTSHAEIGVSVRGDQAIMYNAKGGRWLNRYYYPDERLGRLFGYWLAEGSCGAKRHTLDFTFGWKDDTDKRNYVQDCARLIQDLTGIMPTEDHPSASVIRLRVCSVPLCNMFTALLGEGAANKRVPLSWLSGQWDFVRGLITGLVRGDGCVFEQDGKSTTLIFGSTSVHLAEAVRLALSRAGYCANMRVSKKPDTMVSPTNGKTYKTKPQWNTRLQVPEGCTWDEVLERERPPQDGLGRAEATDGGWWVPIRKKELLAYGVNPPEVYNLDCDGDSTYTVEGVTVHNCDFLTSGNPYFQDAYVDRMALGWKGFRPPVEGQRYLKAFDIGRRNDPTVALVADITDFSENGSIPADIVWYERRLNMPYDAIVERIMTVHKLFPGDSHIESLS